MNHDPTSGADGHGHTPLLAEMRGVRFRFLGQPAVLFQDVDVAIGSGEVVLLVGPNGSGKSTLLGLLSGRLRPTAGRVCVFGVDPSRADRLPELGVITEPFHPEQSPLPVDLTLGQVIEWLHILDGLSGQAVRHGLKDVRLDHLPLHRPVRLFSKGERQRVLLLVVLLRRPRLILADEPLEGLDRVTRQVTTELLLRLSGEGASLLWVSHHLSEIVSRADRVLEIEDGHLRERSADRFRVSVSVGDGQFHVASAWGLHMLADLAGTALEKNSSVRLDITREE